MGEEKSYKTLFKHAENIGLTQEQIRVVCEAMDEHNANMKQSRDTWESIALNCQEDLKNKINELNKIKTSIFYVCFEKDKYGKEPIFGHEDKEILKQKLIDKIKPDLTDYYQKLNHNEIWNHIEKCGEYEIIEINRA